MKYSIREINENIIAIVVPNDYDRAMLFCRVQEFYESPNEKFRNNNFSIWNYCRWYSQKFGNGCFSYPKDFVGYNFPLIVAKKCYQINSVETPYDEEMIKIIDAVFEEGKRKYLIGVDNLKNSTFDHELAHAFYYVDINYKNSMNDITKEISKFDYSKFKNNLKSIGYCSSVLKDEIQAYMSTEINRKVTKGVKQKKKLHKLFKSIFNQYKF